MNGLSVAVLLLIVSSCGWTSAQNILRPKSNIDSWLNMDLNDFHDRCHNGKDAKALDILIKEYEKAKGEFFLSDEERVDVEQSNFVMRYIYNTNMISTLKKLIKFMQKCYDNGSPLDSEGVVEVMDLFLKQHAMKIANMERLTVTDTMCFGSEYDRNICKHLLPKTAFFMEQKVGDVLKFGVMKNSTCEKTLPYVECVMGVLKKCSPRVRGFLKVVLSPPEVGVCNNYPKEEDLEIEGVGEEIDEGINDLFMGEEKKSFSFKKLFRL